MTSTAMQLKASTRRMQVVLSEQQEWKIRLHGLQTRQNNPTTKMCAAVHNELHFKGNWRQLRKKWSSLHSALPLCPQHSEKEENRLCLVGGAGVILHFSSQVYWAHQIKRDIVPVVWVRSREKLFWTVQITEIQFKQVELLTFHLYLSLSTNLPGKNFFYSPLSRYHVNVLCCFILTSQTLQSHRLLNPKLRALSTCWSSKPPSPTGVLMSPYLLRAYLLHYST